MYCFTTKAQSARRGSGALCLLLFTGCATAPTKLTIDSDETLVVIDDYIRPEKLLFPEYLMLEDAELEQHGRIPGTPVLGTGLVIKAKLGVVHRRYREVLSSKGWTVEQFDADRQSFRIKAAGKEGEIEIRAVQGTKRETHVFILLTPAAD